MQRFFLFLIISSTALSAICQESSPPAPLTNGEKRQIISQLYELQAARSELAAFTDFVAREKDQDARERTNSDRALELERLATQLAQQERDLAKEKAATFEALYKAATHKRSLGCTLAKVFTLGLARCN
jgi:Na+-translocating ferredoxin:NAD+ oxidoreductase RnfC subunit